MAVETLVPVEEYLNTAYDPDMEYVDGVLVERNVGDWLHSLVQSNCIFALRAKYPHIYVVPELRSRTRETRYRLPDVSVLLKPPATRYLLDAAFVAIEILSPDDHMGDTLEKLEEYDQKGVPHIWVVDPRRHKISTYAGGVLTQIHSNVIATGDPRLELTREEIFRQ
ncbi:MAG: Uma2 family endonuclease [Bryobacterales bacterium]|nr:Uma2 family endonuclease [Bryobacterales bacterium]MBV9400956.1 Uma2 family endonuclease [Bryobacterales bacterium]